MNPESKSEDLRPCQNAFGPDLSLRICVGKVTALLVSQDYIHKPGSDVIRIIEFMWSRCVEVGVVPFVGIWDVNTQAEWLERDDPDVVPVVGHAR